MNEPSKKPNLQMLESLNFVWDVVIIIALPTTLLALGGRWLDSRFNVSPWFTIAGLVISLATSYILISRKAKEIAKRIGSTKK